MKFSANWLNEYLKKPLKPQQMAEALMMHAFEVESVEKKGNDFVLDIKVLPNRAHDCLSHLGIAKEVAAVSGAGFVPPKVEVNTDKSLEIKDFVSVQVPAKDLCPRYSMMMVADVRAGSSPKWMQERLTVCGLRPINNIVDITNYVMLETGQPLHAFDLDKVGGKKIIVRRAQENEEIITLDEARAEKVLKENMLVIADEKRAIGIAGIKGGRGTEIDEKTKNIVIEAANFEPINIRRTAQALDLKTDASTRFENGLDPNLTISALARCVSLTKEICGGRIVSGVIDIYSKKVSAWKIVLDVEVAQSLLGIKISAQEMIAIFKRLGIVSQVIKKGKKIFIEVAVPTSRLDLVSQEDLIEEVARIYGYDKIPPQTPRGLLVSAIKNENLIYLDKIKDILAALGYSETYNYSLIPELDSKILNLKNLISIKNPLSQDQKYVRPNLAIGLLKNLRENLKHFSSVRLFELGQTFYQSEKNFLEESKIGAIIFDRNHPRSADNFFELKGVIDVLFEKLGVPDLWFDDQISLKHSWLELVHPLRRAEIKVGETLVGWIGEVASEILTLLTIKEKPAIFELDFKTMVELASEERIYVPPSKFPAIGRDLTVSVEQETKIEQVTNIIENTGGILLRDVDLFDIYESEELANKKSLTFRLIYQSDERNLTDKEANELQEKIIEALEEKGWEIRK